MADLTGIEGFVQIHPEIIYSTRSPDNGEELKAEDWEITGLWTLAKVSSADGRRKFWTDLPYGVGVFAPSFVNIDTGVATRPDGADWYLSLTANAWRNKVAKDVTVKAEVRRKAENACLVNCLYPWWADAANLLLRINQIRKNSDLDIVVIITPDLRWLVPDYVAEIWIVELGDMRKAAEWNEKLAVKIKELAGTCKKCYIPSIVQPAKLTQDELVEFTSIKPFPRAEWLKRLKAKPTVTFMWRIDRCWSAYTDRMYMSTFLNSPAAYRWPAKLIARFYKRWLKKMALRDQLRRVVALAKNLKLKLPGVDFAVCGLGKTGRLPSWVRDMRVDSHDTEKVDRSWCERAAESHVLITVSGSHMALPNGHAGAVIELIPRWYSAATLTDLMVTSEDIREALYCYRSLPLDIDPYSMNDITLGIIYNYPYVHYAYHNDYYKPLPKQALGEMAREQKERWAILDKISSLSSRYLIGP